VQVVLVEDRPGDIALAWTAEHTAVLR
jgi:hypothetical protein